MGGDPLLQVYREIDAAVGSLIDSVPSDVTLLVQLSHGMTVHNDGTHLLDEVLTLLERSPSKKRLFDRLKCAAKPALPALRRFAAKCRFPVWPRRLIGQWLRSERPHHRASRRFYQTPNNYVHSGIRLNLVGREPKGRVEVAEIDGVCRDLERDLLELINVAAGEPAIRSVVRCDDHHRRQPDDTMPDLFVEWDRSAPIETVYSPKIGTVHTRYGGWRSGDHRADGLLLAVGPDIPAGASFAPIKVEDIGASIAARLGAPLENVDGAVVPWLAGADEVLGESPASCQRRAWPT